MKESDDSSTHLREDSTTPHVHRLRRRRLICFASIAVFLLVLLAAGLTLAFTVFQVKNPTTELISSRVSGVSPRITLPAVNLAVNVTLALSILVHNPNFAAFRHDAGQALLFYRGLQVGGADVDSGRIPARGSEDVGASMTVTAERFTSKVGDLAADVLGGQVGFDSTARIPGRVVFLGIFTHRAVALSECHVVVGFPDLRIRRQDCSHQTQL